VKTSQKGGARRRWRQKCESFSRVEIDPLLWIIHKNGSISDYPQAYQRDRQTRASRFFAHFQATSFRMICAITSTIPWERRCFSRLRQEIEKHMLTEEERMNKSLLPLTRLVLVVSALVTGVFGLSWLVAPWFVDNVLWPPPHGSGGPASGFGSANVSRYSVAIVAHSGSSGCHHHRR
jgi:hypothetical protein